MDYRSKQWKTLRRGVLRRDGYLCRECRRYGRSREACTVHHILPAREYPQYALCGWNLISLCSRCHDAMHDRTTDALTDRGRFWAERTVPPPSD